MRVKMGSDDEWKRAAMVDDGVVAELLLRLNQGRAKPAAAAAMATIKSVLPLEWSVRQRRSKAVCVSSSKKLAPRASPSTPLSWSGATSVSGGGGGGGGVGVIDGGSEESSKPQPPRRVAETTRSKVTSEANTSKRARKKKTLAELKEEEILLLKERRQLKKDLITLRTNLQKEMVTNENLKRMKLDLQSQMANESGIGGGFSDPPAAVVPITELGHAAALQFSPPGSSRDGQKEVTKFELPDLNLPFEDDCNIKVLCGVS